MPDAPGWPPGAGREVCGALAQQQAAARLAGQLPPSLLACAEQVCTQAEAMLTQAPWQGQQAAVQVGPQSASQLEHVVSQLYTGDLQELSRLVLLLRGMRRAVGQEPLPRALRRVLQDSGLAAWLQQHGPAGAAAAVGSQQQRLGGGGDLPASLRCVLDKAEQLAAEWQQQQAEGRGRRPAGSGVGGAADGGSWCPAHAAGAASQQEAGEELVRELLARLATDTAADECAVQRRSGAASQRQQQAPGCDPGALTIGTIHSAKGLEWPVVLLPSVCQGLLPLRFRPPAWQAGDGAAALRACPRAHLEEERRLFHVAATRARDTLLVSFVQPPPPGAPAEPGGRGWAAVGVRVGGCVGLVGGLPRWDGPGVGSQPRRTKARHMPPSPPPPNLAAYLHAQAPMRTLTTPQTPPTHPPGTRYCRGRGAGGVSRTGTAARAGARRRAALLQHPGRHGAPPAPPARRAAL